MKLMLLFLISLWAISSCDAPRDRSAVYNRTLNGGYQPSPNNQNTNTTGSGSGSGSGSGTGNGSSYLTTEFSHCQFSGSGESTYAFSHNHIGLYNLCQSSQSTDKFMLQVKETNKDNISAQICLIPMYHSGSTAVYIGEPVCQYPRDTLTPMYYTLNRNRIGYGGYNTTSIMIMRDITYYFPPPFNTKVLDPDAFLYCVNWLAQTGDSSYCNAFNQVGAYIFHQL